MTSLSSASDRDGTPTQARKADHLRACLQEDVAFRRVSTGFERYRFNHCCLPELDRDRVHLETSFLGKSLKVPLLISSMTGGTDLARVLNERLAAAAQRYGLAMGVGSQRVAIERPAVADSFTLRRVAPDALLLANLGAVQLNYGYGLEQARQAVDQLEADALILHLNPLQEAVQTRGDRDFSGLLAKIADLCAALPVPVVAKEVGNGISAAMAIALIDAGVAAIDVAGAGGTSWAKVESARATDPMQRRLGSTFAEWGIPTAECLTAIREVAPTVPTIASGGLRHGLDVAKAIALGADLAGMALPFLQGAHESEAALDFVVEATIAELQTVLFCTGCADLAALRSPGVLCAIA